MRDGGWDSCPLTEGRGQPTCPSIDLTGALWGEAGVQGSIHGQGSPDSGASGGAVRSGARPGRRQPPELGDVPTEMQGQPSTRMKEPGALLLWQGSVVGGGCTLPLGGYLQAAVNSACLICTLARRAPHSKEPETRPGG